MELPQIEIPKAIIDSIPLDQIPALGHPPLVHFAMVLPIMIVLLELVNIIVKRGATPEEPKGKGVSTLSFLLILAMVVIFAAAYVSGSVDGKAAWDALGDAGQAELKEHKLIGTYLVYGSIALLLFKLFSFTGGKMRVLLLLLAIVFAAGTLKQGKDGGELVYEHGANVAKVKALDDKIFDLEEELDDLKSASTEKAEPAKEESAPKDSVATEEAAAIAAPEAVAGEAAAEAKVEETVSKDAFEAKEAAESLKEEAVADEKKEVTTEEAAPAAATDSVATEEAVAIADPEAIPGQVEAQAKVEEATEIVKAEAEAKAEGFAKETAADVEKTVTPEAH